MTTKPTKQYFSFFYKSYSRYDPKGYRQKNSQNSKKKPFLKGCQSVATYVWITVSQDSPLKGRDCDGAVRCGAVRCGAVRCSAVQCCSIHCLQAISQDLYTPRGPKMPGNYSVF